MLDGPSDCHLVPEKVVGYVMKVRDKLLMPGV